MDFILPNQTKRKTKKKEKVLMFETGNHNH